MPCYRILECMVFHQLKYLADLQEDSFHWCLCGNTYKVQKLLQTCDSLVISNLLQASCITSHMQLCNPCVSQYGTHLPPRHNPLSWHCVPSTIGGDFGHSAWFPAHRASCSQVAYWASLHFTPAGMYWQFWQQGEFLSLQTAPWFRRNLQFLSQHASLSSVPKRPASHCSSPSTRRFPQKDSSGSEKQRPDFAWRTFRMARSEHGENFWITKKRRRLRY